MKQTVTLLSIFCLVAVSQASLAEPISGLPCVALITRLKYGEDDSRWTDLSNQMKAALTADYPVFAASGETVPSGQIESAVNATAPAYNELASYMECLDTQAISSKCGAIEKLPAAPTKNAAGRYDSRPAKDYVGKLKMIWGAANLKRTCMLKHSNDFVTPALKGTTDGIVAPGSPSGN